MSDGTLARLADLADSVEQLIVEVRRIANAARSSRTVDLAPVLTSGPALGDPLGYLVIGERRGSPISVRTAYLEPTREDAERFIVSSGSRVVAVYDLPTEVQP